MSSNKGAGRAYVITIILLAVGVVCYAAFPQTIPDEPVRKIFKCTAGKVMFTHQAHGDPSGYALSCFDCHHHNEEDAPELKACGDCHAASKARTVPEICSECHSPSEEHHHSAEDITEEESYACSDCHQKKPDEMVPGVCADCHEPEDIEGEDIEMNFQKRSDAFHGQCIDCHKEYGSGPVECSSCHVM